MKVLILDQFYIKNTYFLIKVKTFKQTYERLKEEIEDLFIINANDILNFDYKPINQLEKGTIQLSVTCHQNFQMG